MTTKPHWAVQYVGMPWTACGRGPKEFDCWGLVWWVSREHYNVELPDFPLHPDRKTDIAKLMTEQVTSGKWARLREPEDGCVVALSMNAVIHHVGLYVLVDSGLVLHADYEQIRAQTFTSLRLSGYTRIEFYKWQPFTS